MLAATLPKPDEHVEVEAIPHNSRVWQTVVWNDPVNLMSYVVHVFREYFGFPRDKAERLMLEVHHEGRTVVAQGAREQMELHARAMHDYGLWATVREAPQ